MTNIPCVRDPVRGGIWVTDDGRGTFLPGAEKGTGTLQGMWGGDDGWINGRAHEDTIWASGRGYMELDSLGYGGRTADVPHELTSQVRNVELLG